MKMRTSLQKHNSQKYCEYHNDHDHLTEDCITLRRESRFFIQNEKLIKFLASEKVRNNSSWGSRPQRMEPQSAFSEGESD